MVPTFKLSSVTLDPDGLAERQNFNPSTLEWASRQSSQANEEGGGRAPLGRLSNFYLLAVCKEGIQLQLQATQALDPATSQQV